MRKAFGKGLMYIGAYLWQLGGDWSKSEGPAYEDLSWYGKIGYHLMVTGMKTCNISPNGDK